MQTVTTGDAIAGGSLAHALVPAAAVMIPIAKVFIWPSTWVSEGRGEKLQWLERFFEAEGAMSQPAEITVLLRAWGQGDQDALQRLTRLVHAELHREASEPITPPRSISTRSPTWVRKEGKN